MSIFSFWNTLILGGFSIWSGRFVFLRLWNKNGCFGYWYWIKCATGYDCSTSSFVREIDCFTRIVFRRYDKELEWFWSIGIGQRGSIAQVQLFWLVSSNQLRNSFMHGVRLADNREDVEDDMAQSICD